MSVRGTYSWPKQLPQLTEEQERIRDDFMHYWHDRLGKTAAFGPLEQFNHGYSIRNRPDAFTRTLEIGAGLGEHLRYEHLTPEQRQNYWALELRQNMVEQLRESCPEIQAVRGDCQQTLDFPDGYFDRILAIHVLEHLPNLPAAVREMHRLCDKTSGIFSVVIPCEGGAVYTVARAVSSQRMFEQRYKQPYKWFIEQEHLSVPAEILDQLEKHFTVIHRQYFPFLLPMIDLNLCIGLTLRPRSY